MTELSENTVSDWKINFHTRVADWLLANSCPLGGPGVVVEVDEAKFGKIKYNKGGFFLDLSSTLTNGERTTHLQLRVTVSTHGSVNQTYQFVDPHTSIHTNTPSVRGI